MSHKVSDRLDWTIVERSRCFATHNVTGETLIAPNRAALNSQINAWDKANQDKIVEHGA